jgi:hypothetical protein
MQGSSQGSSPCCPGVCPVALVARPRTRCPALPACPLAPCTCPLLILCPAAMHALRMLRTFLFRLPLLLAWRAAASRRTGAFLQPPPPHPIPSLLSHRRLEPHTAWCVPAFAGPCNKKVACPPPRPSAPDWTQLPRAPPGNMSAGALTHRPCRVERAPPTCTGRQAGGAQAQRGRRRRKPRGVRGAARRGRRGAGRVTRSRPQVAPRRPGRASRRWARAARRTQRGGRGAAPRGARGASRCASSARRSRRRPRCPSR